MKNLFYILCFLFFGLSYSQNQNFTGVKTFIAPPKFLNLQYSTTNTKFLTLNGSNQLMWSVITPGLQDAPSNGNLYARLNGSWSVVPSASLKEWIGYIYQNGTASAPVTSSVLKNTLSGITVASTWTRNSVGSYNIRLPFYTNTNAILIELYKDGDIGSSFPYDTHIRYVLSGDGMAGTQINILSTAQVSGVETPVELDGYFKIRIYQF